MDWWQTDVFSEPMQDIRGTTGAQRLMDLSLSHFLQEEQWHGCVVLHAYIVHMFRWRSGFEIYDMPLKCLHISQTTSYHHLISSQLTKSWDEMRSKWSWTIAFPVSPDVTDGVTLPFQSCQITYLELQWLPASKWNWCAPQSFFFFSFKVPWWTQPLRCATVVMDLVPLHCTLQMWQLNNSDCQKALGYTLSVDSR